MPLDDRPYFRDSDAETTPLKAQFAGMSISMVIIAVCVVMYIADQVLYFSERAHAFAPTVWGAFTVPKAVDGWQLWRWFTYQFIHSTANFFHILFNMMILVSFGPMLERWWGRWRFLAFYLLCGISGAAVFTAWTYLGGHAQLDRFAAAMGMQPRFLVGSSGSIFGILIGAAILYPTQRVSIFFTPFHLSVRAMAGVLIGISVISILVGSQNAGGEAAHLGGLALGAILVLFPRTLGFIPFEPKTAAERRENRSQKKIERERQQRLAAQAEVDRILDKVKQHGLHSLSNREKKALQQATDRQRRAG